MVSFLSSTSQPSAVKDAGPYPCHFYEHLYQGPIDVTPDNMPELFDILLSDIDENVLQNEISTALGSAYLSKTPHLTTPHTTIDGIMFGRHRRVLFPLVLRFPKKSSSMVVHFIYDSGSPFTFLSEEACDKIFGTNPVPSDFVVQINGQNILVNPPNANSHFPHVNLLGTDFCAVSGAKIVLDYRLRSATLQFPYPWE
ncbi:hypothetical protein Egran_03296 [Elaphomyces granulatus]|uniref:Uncharacterized protein n=1 Tax=Elaphomyces granulatus TaxID=519963 RepID=A0A232LXQ2_9EURO|nr:hypothetical protein Egran_03296 [Elaphomyces granulatus]